MSRKQEPITEIHHVTVSDPKPHPEKNFTMYKVRIEAHSVSVDQEPEVVEFYKRFSEFKKLEHSLGTYHKQLYRAEPFPSLPSTGYFNRKDTAVIEKRRKAAEDMLQFIFERHYLYKHTVFIEFCSSSCDKDDAT
ncbi:Sorting nexin-15 [Paragonimus heterotremus]|uniref:Sorting nexin-15 n=1 Tax=Paragonimus heterotremus TaxID=100268 RepID=A0A8J4SZM8_9TREM|nr:Sorting nexin-15 [Paragonimus heterotremus]